MKPVRDEPFPCFPLRWENAATSSNKLASRWIEMIVGARALSLKIIVGRADRVEGHLVSDLTKMKSEHLKS